MMGAFSFLFSLWHAAICESAAFTTRRCDFARSIVAYRVSHVEYIIREPTFDALHPLLARSTCGERFTANKILKFFL